MIKAMSVISGSVLNQLERFWKERPLASILFISFAVRLLAIIFSKGYAMHDDHFLMIEAAQSWVDGADYNNWLPENSDQPTGHSFFYVGLHYIFFLFLESLGVIEPQTKMYLVRFIHAVYSLSIVYFSYKITERLSNVKVAKQVGLLLALLWMMPMFSVRNMVEFICIPPLLIAIWIFIKNEGNLQLKHYLFAGLISGISLAFRVHCVLFLAGIGLYLLYERKIIGGVLFGASVFASFFLTQIADLFTWGYPFAEIGEYIGYNLENAETYFSAPWYNYILMVFGFLIPPISLFFVFGFFRKGRKHFIIFIPVALFFIFHSWHPNKQERFIMPVLPFIIILGNIGWHGFLETSGYWKKRQQLYRSCWIFFWVVNTLLCTLFTFSYHKKARIEGMEFLGRQSDFKNVIVESSHRYGAILLPRFYGKNWNSQPVFDKSVSYDALNHIIEVSDNSVTPNYIIALENENIDERIANFERNVCKLEKVAYFEPGFYDKFIHWLNPVNNNETCTIYRMLPDSTVQ